MTARLGIHFVQVTHSQEEAMALAGMVVVMKKPADRTGRPAARPIRTPVDGLRFALTSLATTAQPADRRLDSFSATSAGSPC
jgi:ABC-type sugar transport system ATPase subunit